MHKGIYFKKGMRVLIQGATGKEGQRALSFMKNYYTNVVAGVTPKKGGQKVDGVPVFNTVKEAIDAVGYIDISSIYVPALAVKSAVTESVESGIKFINIMAESIPYKDLAYITSLCENNNVELLGPGSLGILVVDEGRIGMIGGINPKTVYKRGNTSVISRSGGMANEIAHHLLNRSIGIRSVIHLGSEISSGSTLVKQIRQLYDDEETDTIMIFEEVTNNNLSELLKFFTEEKIKKLIKLNLVGVAQDIMPKGVPFGHVDSLTKKDDKLLDDIEALKKVGIDIVDSYERFADATISK